MLSRCRKSVCGAHYGRAHSTGCGILAESECIPHNLPCRTFYINTTHSNENTYIDSQTCAGGMSVVTADNLDISQGREHRLRRHSGDPIAVLILEF